MPVYNFFNAWLANMQTITSKHALKINTISLLATMNQLPLDYLTNNLAQICSRVIPDIIQYQAQKTQLPAQERSTEKRNLNPKFRLTEGCQSLRKEINRSTQLYDNVNLLQLFQTKFNVQLIVPPHHGTATTPDAPSTHNTVRHHTSAALRCASLKPSSSPHIMPRRPKGYPPHTRLAVWCGRGGDCMFLPAFVILIEAVSAILNGLSAQT